MKWRPKEREPRPGADDFHREVMTLREVAAFLRCHCATVQRLIHIGEIPAFRVGSDFRFLRADLNNWIAEQRVRNDRKRRPDVRS